MIIAPVHAMYNDIHGLSCDHSYTSCYTLTYVYAAIHNISGITFEYHYTPNQSIITDETQAKHHECHASYIANGYDYIASSLTKDS